MAKAYRLKQRSLDERLWARIVVDELRGCWLWTGATGAGYGLLSIRPTPTEPGKLRSVPRLMYEKHKGPIPEGLIIRHQCDTPACCNPDHLLVGTYKQNEQDKKDRGRQRYLFGEQNPHHKLSSIEVNQIKNDPRRQYTIAADYGINQSQVSRIKSGKRRPKS